jgi:xanthine dehydrogenase YagS FAD-binding subunit
MRPFVFEHTSTIAGAIQAAGRAKAAEFLAGGTSLIDLMKLDVMRPDVLIDINRVSDSAIGKITRKADGLRLGALVRMADAADHPEIRKNFPMISQALELAASAQLRNMASLGGNVLQRTRCTYFRDVSYAACNKRNRGSGCAAMSGVNRMHAVLGTSESCIATYPGDFAQALIALDASVEIVGRGQKTRVIPFAALHRPPGETPDVETVLQPGEMIASFTVPMLPWARRSLFLKVRDRQSYEFALAAAAVALDLQGDTVRDLRIGLGGVATVPWRAKAAEDALRGKPLNDETAAAASAAAFAGAQGREHNAFKVELGKRTLMRALRQAAALEI